MWGVELEVERRSAPGAHLFPAAPLPPAASASLEKPAAQETAGGAQTAAPPARRPPAPHRDRPTHLKGPWLRGLPPSRRLPPTPPTPAGGAIYNSAPIPRLPPGGRRLPRQANRRGDLCAPRGRGDKFSFRKFGGTFSKTPRPREGESENPSALSLPPASRQAAQVPKSLEPS